jgi:hypothetical protein
MFKSCVTIWWAVFSLILSRVGVTIRRVSDWLFWIYCTYALVITSNRSLSLISALYSSLLQTLVSSVYYSLHCPFPGDGF